MMLWARAVWPPEQVTSWCWKWFFFFPLSCDPQKSPDTPGSPEGPPSGGLSPSARMGRRRARLWALFQRCNPKAKARTRKDLASAHVLEAERPEVPERTAAEGPQH